MYGQLSGPGSNAVRYTRYPSLPGVNDPVFIFCNSSGSVKGTLSASSPGGTPPYVFTWTKWNDGTDSFSDPVIVHPNATVSTITNLDEGGYMVSISDGGGYNTTLRGWVSIDKPFASAALLNRTCDYVALDGDTATDHFRYRDITNGNQVLLPNAVKFMWSSQPSSAIPYPDYIIDPQTFTPPLEDVVYKIEVTDSFQCASVASFAYESIHVKAEFTIDPQNGEAPLEVTFTDKSIRGSIYKWDFGDGSDTTLQDPPPHIYYKPGTYSALLTIESDLHCIDSMRISNIVVDPSKLDVPNVFTPDGDTYNDYFRVDSKSLRLLSIEIFSRSGLKVYSFRGEGEALSEWQGWDGNINNSSIKAAPGIYYYLVTAYGWDDIEYDGKKYTGFLYLYR